MPRKLGAGHASSAMVKGVECREAWNLYLSARPTRAMGHK